MPPHVSRIKRELERLRAHSPADEDSLVEHASGLIELFGADPSMALDALIELEVPEWERQNVEAALVGMGLSAHKQATIRERYASWLGVPSLSDSELRKVQRWSSDGVVIMASRLVGASVDTMPVGVMISVEPSDLPDHVYCHVEIGAAEAVEDGMFFLRWGYEPGHELTTENQVLVTDELGWDEGRDFELLPGRPVSVLVAWLPHLQPTVMTSVENDGMALETGTTIFRDSVEFHVELPMSNDNT